MKWNWQRADWPNFTYDPAALERVEAEFLVRSGEFVGAFRHVSPDDQDTIRIELISDEALKTSEIEGEILNRDSLQSSLRQQFGLGNDTRRVPPHERGIAEMMVDLYRTFAVPLNRKTLFAWHKMVMAGYHGIEVIGGYRRHADPMQVVSGPSAIAGSILKRRLPTGWARRWIGSLLVQQDGAGREASVARADAGRYRAHLFREHPSV